MKPIFLLPVFSLFLCSCSWINSKMGLDDDNLLEEILEEVIKDRTGADIDLTPSSEE